MQLSIFHKDLKPEISIGVISTLPWAILGTHGQLLLDIPDRTTGFLSWSGGKNTNERKSCEPWVVAEMTPEEKVVDYVRHGVENTASKIFEEQIRCRSYKGGPGQDVCTELIRKVDAAREIHRTYRAGIEREEGIRAREI